MNINYIADILFLLVVFLVSTTMYYFNEDWYNTLNIPQWNLQYVTLILLWTSYVISRVYFARKGEHFIDLRPVTYCMGIAFVISKFFFFACRNISMALVFQLAVVCISLAQCLLNKNFYVVNLSTLVLTISLYDFIQTIWINENN